MVLSLVSWGNHYTDAPNNPYFAALIKKCWRFWNSFLCRIVEIFNNTRGNKRLDAFRNSDHLKVNPVTRYQISSSSCDVREQQTTPRAVFTSCHNWYFNNAGSRCLFLETAKWQKDVLLPRGSIQWASAEQAGQLLLSCNKLRCLPAERVLTNSANHKLSLDAFTCVIILPTSFIPLSSPQP